MKQLTVISGKGGTGKTSITAALASVLNKPVLADCDVDASNLYLLMDPDIKAVHDFPGGYTAEINQDKCIVCGKCASLCRFDAITERNGMFTVNNFSCEGCRLCYHSCPAGAVGVIQSFESKWFESDTRYGPMLHASLGAGEELSGKLISLLREKARRKAGHTNAELILVDGPPGVGCPVISSLTGADLALIVTEPSMSGLQDLKRVHELSRHFRIPARVIINKYDINYEMAEETARYCSDNDLEIIARIPYNRVFLDAMIQRQTVTEYDKNHEISRMIKGIAEGVLK